MEVQKENESDHELLSPCQALANLLSTLRRIHRRGGGGHEFSPGDGRVTGRFWKGQSPIWRGDAAIHVGLSFLVLVYGVISQFYRASRTEDENGVLSLRPYLSSALRGCIHRGFSEFQSGAAHGHISIPPLRHVLPLL